MDTSFCISGLLGGAIALEVTPESGCRAAEMHTPVGSEEVWAKYLVLEEMFLSTTVSCQRLLPHLGPSELPLVIPPRRRIHFDLFTVLVAYLS